MRGARHESSPPPPSGRTPRSSPPISRCTDATPVLASSPAIFFSRGNPAGRIQIDWCWFAAGVLMAGVFMVLLVIVAVGLSLIWRSQRSESIIHTWARENGYEVISAERQFLWRGPFWLRSDKNQTVYRITVRDASGRTRRGWARCGGWVFGLMSDTVTVEWDD